MVTLSPEPERKGKPDFGQHLAVVRDQLGENLIPDLDRDNVRKSEYPDLRMITGLLNALNCVNLKKLRVNGPLIEA